MEVTTPDLERAVAFYRDVWGLTLVGRDARSAWFRGTGVHHHIFALRETGSRPAIERIVFDGGDRATTEALWARVKRAVATCGDLRDEPAPGGGFGFEFVDVESRRMAVVCDAAQHADGADAPDRPRKLAHVNFNSVDHARTTAFLCDVLGFRLIDETGGLLFLHCDNRDHASIVIAKGGGSTLNHIAFEAPDIDSVMRGSGRMIDRGYPIEWGVGRHGAGDNVFAYFAGPDELPIELTSDILQIDDTYTPRGPEHWTFPPGRMDQWGVTRPHTPRWKRIQNLYAFVD